MIKAFVKITDYKLMKFIQRDERHISCGELGIYWIPRLENGKIICTSIDDVPNLIEEGYLDCTNGGEICEESAVYLFSDLVEISNTDDTLTIEEYIEVLNDANSNDQEYLRLGFGVGDIQNKVINDVKNRWKIIDMLEKYIGRV